MQDLHGYDNPWPAGGGTNLVPNVYAFNSGHSRLGVTFTYGDDGILYLNGTATSGYEEELVALDNLSVGTYTAKAESSAAGVAIYVRKNGTFVGSIINNPVTFSVETGDLVLFTIITANGATYSNMALKLILSAGSSVGEWTPYSNICPISGHTGAEIEQTGKNLFPYETIPAYSYAWYSGSKELADAVQPILLRAGHKYALSATPDITSSTESVLIRTWRKNGTILDNEPTVLNARIFNTTARFIYQSTPKYYSAPASNVSTVKVYIEPTEDLWVDIAMKSDGGVGTYPQLEIGEITEYAPYTGNQISVTFPSEAGTVYGGTLTINPDRTGTLVVDRAKAIYDGTVNTSNWYSHDANYNTWGFYSNYDDSWRSVIGLSPIGGLRTSHLPTVSSAYNTDAACCSLALQNGAMQYMAFRIPKSLIDTPTSESNLTELIVAWLSENPIEICFKIEPITYTLTAEQVSGILTALDGINVIWANTGDVTVTYIAKSAKFSFGSPLHIYNHNNLKLFGNTYIEHGKG